MEGCTPCRMPLPTSARRKAAIARRDRKSTRLNSSHGYISYAVFCLKKKKTIHAQTELASELVVVTLLPVPAATDPDHLIPLRLSRSAFRHLEPDHPR